MSQTKIQLPALIAAVTSFTIEGQAEPVSLTVPVLSLFDPIEGWRKRVLATGVTEEQFNKLVTELGTVSAQNPSDAAATWASAKFPQPEQMAELVAAVKTANASTSLTAREAEILVAIGNWTLDVVVEIADEGDLKANAKGEIEVEEIIAFVQLSLEPTAPVATAEDVAAALKVPVIARKTAAPTATAEKPAAEAPVEQVAAPVAETSLPAAQVPVEKGVAVNDATLNSIAANIRQRMEDLKADEGALAIIETQLASIRSRANTARGAIMDDLQGFLQLAQGATTAEEVVEAVQAEA